MLLSDRKSKQCRGSVSGYISKGDGNYAACGAGYGRKVSGRRSSQSLEKSVAQGKTQTEMQNIGPENGTLGEEIPGETDLLQDYVKQETGKLVQRVVNELPEKYRVVVLLHYSMDLTTQEIADQLKISRGTVTSRLLRARKKIKQELEANGYER